MRPRSWFRVPRLSCLVPSLPRYSPSYDQSSASGQVSRGVWSWCMPFPGNDPCRHARHGGSRRDISCNHGIRSDNRMIAYRQRSDQFCTCAYVDVTAQNNPACQCDLVENHAVYPDRRIGVDDDACWVGQPQAATDLGVQVDFGLADGRPPKVVQRPVFRNPTSEHIPPRLRSLIPTHSAQQFLAGVPELADCFARPVWPFCGYA